MFKRTISAIVKIEQWVLIQCIVIYRYVLSPFFRPNCRFYPSCSEYAQDAIRVYGVFKGVYLMCQRLLRCHPFHQGGYDPLPNMQEDHE